MTQIGPYTLDSVVVSLFVAAALGMFVGLEREWSNKSAGIRTFTLTSLIGAVATILDSVVLLALGGALVVVQAGLLGVRGLISGWQDPDADGRGLSLTTSTSLLVAYTVGVLVASDRLLIGVVLAITSSLLLVLRRELHGFASRLSHEEVRSAAEFAIIAFVVYPVLPTGSYGPWDAITPRTVWLLVIAVSGIGFVNYAITQRYGGRGLAITGFFGGLVNSTAVVGSIAARARRQESVGRLAVSAILLADAAMAVRNLVIVVVFVPSAAVRVGLPLGLVAVVGVGLAFLVGDWDRDLDLEFDSPFSTRSALKFGALFLAVLVLTAGAQDAFGSTGFLVSSLLSGVVSSGTTTTTAVTLAAGGQISPAVAGLGVLAGTLSSVGVKVALAASIDRSLVVPVSQKSLYLVVTGVVGVVVVQPL